MASRWLISRGKVRWGRRLRPLTKGRIEAEMEAGQRLHLFVKASALFWSWWCQHPQPADSGNLMVDGVHSTRLFNCADRDVMLTQRGWKLNAFCQYFKFFIDKNKKSPSIINSISVVASLQKSGRLCTSLYVKGIKSSHDKEKQNPKKIRTCHFLDQERSVLLIQEVTGCKRQAAVKNNNIQLYWTAHHGDDRPVIATETQGQLSI